MEHMGMGVPNNYGSFIMENPNLKWRVYHGIPILGNLQIWNRWIISCPWMSPDMPEGA